MAEATGSQHPAPAPAPHSATVNQDAQVILQSSRDGELQPDAMRGSEHLLKDLLANGDVVDLEAERRDNIEGKSKK